MNDTINQPTDGPITLYLDVLTARVIDLQNLSVNAHKSIRTKLIGACSRLNNHLTFYRINAKGREINFAFIKKGFASSVQELETLLKCMKEPALRKLTDEIITDVKGILGRLEKNEQ